MNLLAKDIDVRLQWPVTEIDYRTIPIRISSKSGNILHASHVVVTVPISVLLKHIRYIPALGRKKVEAIRSFGCGGR